MNTPKLEVFFSTPSDEFTVKVYSNLGTIVGFYPPHMAEKIVKQCQKAADSKFKKALKGVKK